MAIQIRGTTVIDDRRNISNVGTVTATSFSGNGSALTGIDSGGMTLLGTLSTTSGSSVTLSGLDLTSYKFVYVLGDGVSTTDSYDYLQVNSRTLFQLTSGSPAVSAYGVATLDLSSQQSWGWSSTRTLTGWAGATAVTTASTSITLAPLSGSFDAGSIRIYGVA